MTTPRYRLLPADRSAVWAWRADAGTLDLLAAKARGKRRMRGRRLLLLGAAVFDDGKRVGVGDATVAARAMVTGRCSRGRIWAT